MVTAARPRTLFRGQRRRAVPVPRLLRTQGTLDLALHVLDEVIHHGAEIGLLRDLYLHRQTGYTALG